MRGHVDPHQEDELGHEEAAAQVFVDGGPGALDLSEEPEGEDAHGQTDEGDDHAQLGDPGQDDGVSPQLRSKSNRRHFSIRELHGFADVCNLSLKSFGGVRVASQRVGLQGLELVRPGQESDLLSSLFQPDVLLRLQNRTVGN